MNNPSPIRRGGRPSTQRPRRLFCLPPAGAGASLYYPWLDSAPADIEICPLSLPGREDRMREPLASSITTLADQLAADLQPALDRPYAIFGYSMGAMIGYELALRFKILGLPQPDCFITLAARAPGAFIQREPPLHQLNSAAFRNMLADVGGTPREILDNEAAMAIFEPILRNDFRISESWQRTSALPLDCPLLAIHCQQDQLLTEEEVSAWQHCTRAIFRMDTLEEKHMVRRETLLAIPQRIQAFWR